MDTPYTVYYPDGRAEPGTVDWPKDPGWRPINALVKSFIGHDCHPEHVRVLFLDKAADMFVDEMSAVKRLPRNEAATRIYRANWLKHHPETPPETMQAIYGVAVLFGRPIWS